MDKERPVLKFIHRFERLLINALMVMMALVVLFSAVELAWIILKDLLTPPVLLLEIDEVLEIFGLFLLVLIGLATLKLR